jgi:hypothetical protein
VSVSERTEVQVWPDGILPALQAAAAPLINMMSHAWAETDHQARITVLDQCLTATVEYSSPVASATGIPGVSTLIGDIHARYPGFLPVRTSGIDIHHRFARYDWALQNHGGDRVLAGTNVLTFDEAPRIGSVVIFFSPAPRITYTYRTQP